VKKLNILGADIGFDKPQRANYKEGRDGDLEYANDNMRHNQKVDKIILGLNQEGTLKDNQGKEYLVTITSQGVRVVNKLADGTEGTDIYYRNGKRVDSQTPFTKGFSFKPKAVEQSSTKAKVEPVVAEDGSYTDEEGNVRFVPPVLPKTNVENVETNVQDTSKKEQKIDTTAQQVDQVNTNEALRDVESTAKALEGKGSEKLIPLFDVLGEVRDSKFNRQQAIDVINTEIEILPDDIKDAKDKERKEQLQKRLDYLSNPKNKEKEIENLFKELESDSSERLSNSNKKVSEAYHKAKADGSSPELVKAVETLLAPQNTTEAEAPVMPKTEETVAPVNLPPTVVEQDKGKPNPFAAIEEELGAGTESNKEKPVVKEVPAKKDDQKAAQSNEPKKVKPESKSEIAGEKLSDFLEGDTVYRDYNGVYEEYEIVSTKKDIWKLKNTETGAISDWNAANNGGFILKEKETFTTENEEQPETRPVETIQSIGEAAIAEAEVAESVESVQSALEKIEAAINAVNSKIKTLTAAYRIAGIAHETPSYEIAKKAKREITSYMKEIAKMTGWEIEKGTPQMNIAPAGGEIYVRLNIPGTPLSIWATFKYDPDIMTAYGGYDNYTLNEIFYRVENRSAKGQDQYVGPNQYINIGGKGMSKSWGVKEIAQAPSTKELAKIFAKEAIPYVVEYLNANKSPQQTAIADVQDLLSGAKTPQQVIQDIVEQSGIPAANVVVGSMPKPATEPKKKPSPIKDKIKKIENKELDDLWDDFRSSMGTANTGLNPDQLGKGIKIVAKYAELGVLKFADIMNDAMVRLGEKTMQDLLPAIKAAYMSFKTQATKEQRSQMDGEDAVFDYEMPTAETEEIAVEETAPETVADDQKQARRKFVDAIKSLILDNIKISGIVHARKIAEYEGLKFAIDVELQELVELAITEISRDIALRPDLTGQQKLDWINKIYDLQPTISQRSSNRIALQQYSTPLPISFIAGNWVAQKNPLTILEPNAGNGMLVLAFNPDRVTANEIDADRLRNLGEQGFKEVTNQDALLPFDGEYDAIMMNPPFGPSKQITIDGYKIKGLDPQMVVNALQNMTDNGRAGIIIGGHTEYDENGKIKGSERFFFNYLYSHYNVSDVINIDGDLYKKQGTTYPVRLILIDGRKVKDNSPAPREGEVDSSPATSYQDIFNRVQNIKPNEQSNLPPRVDANNQSGETVYGGGRAAQNNQGKPSKSGGVSSSQSGTKRPGSSSGNQSSGRPSGNSSSGSNTGSTSSIADAEQSVPDGNISTVPASNTRTNVAAGSNGTVQRPNDTRPNRSPVDLTAAKNLYQPQSSGTSLGSYVPSSMAQEAYHALENMENSVGMTTDQYVTDRLQYESVEEMQKYFSAEQIDALALAINNLEKNQGMIIGDMTGVGKGRIAAGLIRYSVLNGKKPFFLTVKPELFSDMYRDLNDIDFVNVKPFVVNDESISNPNAPEGAKGKSAILFPMTVVERKKVIDRVKNGDTQPLDDFDVIMSTFSQFQTGIELNGDGSIKDINPKFKAKFFQNAAAGRVLIIDESHNASGASKVGALFREGVAAADGAVFLSATYAKRPDNLLLYASKTAMNEANIDGDGLIGAIQAGGVPLQEIISAQLVEAGQMVRRERMFEEWQSEFIELKDQEKQHRERADAIISVMRQVMKFESDYILPNIKDLKGEIKAGVDSIIKEGGSSQAGIDNAPFASKLFNVVNQMLFAIKAEAAADEAIRAAKEGLKPVVAFQSTMGSFIFSEDGLGLKPGDVLNAGFSVTLQRALEKTLEYKEKSHSGEVTVKNIKIEDLPYEAQQQYREIENAIEAASENVPLSPIDVIIKKLEDAGLTYGEITGRSDRIEYNSDGTGTAVKRSDKDKKQTIAKFNSGQIDVILLNQSGATGFSMHASSKFKDQRQRVMIMVQPELDINIEVQKRGRIDRTGQVVRGLYRMLVSLIPAEQRLWMMYKNKIRSLDANTSGDQKSTKENLDTADFLNAIGDDVVIQYLIDNPDMNELLQDPLKLGTSPTDDNAPVKSPDKDSEKQNDLYGPVEAAKKVSGRVAALMIADQERFYNEVSALYAQEIEYLESNDMNPLEAKVLNLRAKTLSKQKLIVGRGGSSAFGSDSYLEKVEVDVLKKPMKKAEIEKKSAEITDGKSPQEYKAGLLKDMDQYFEKRTQEIKDQSAQRFEEVSAREKAKLDLAIDKENEKEPGSVNSEQRATRQRILLDGVKAEIADKLERDLFSMESDLNAVRKRLSVFNVNEVYGVGTDMSGGDGYVKGAFLGFKIGTKTKNPYAKSNISMAFATADGRREVTIPLSKSDFIDNMLRRQQYMSESERNFERWDESLNNKAREPRMMITGNILQGLASHRGQLITYTTEDGKSKKGILLPKQFKLEQSEQSVNVPIGQAYARRMQSDKIAEPFSAGDVLFRSLLAENGYIEMVVPASRNLGGKYFLNNNILNLVEGRNFFTRSGRMMARVPQENMPALIAYLDNDMRIQATVLREEFFNEGEEETLDSEINDLEKGIDTPPKKSLGDHLRGIADDLDEGTGGPDSLGMNALPIRLVSAALRAAAKAIDLGTSVVDAIRKALETFDEYRRMSAIEKDAALNQVLGMINEQRISPEAQERDDKMNRVRNLIISESERTSVEDIIGMIEKSPKLAAYIEQNMPVADFVQFVLDIKQEEDDAMDLPVIAPSGEFRSKAVVNRAFDEAQDEDIRAELQFLGLNYEVEKHANARAAATEFVQRVGVDKAMRAVRTSMVEGGMAAVIWGIAIDEVGYKIAVTSDPELIMDLRRQEAELIDGMGRQGSDAGRFSSQLQDVYENSDFSYRFTKLRERWIEVGGKMTPELEAKFLQYEEEIRAAKEEIAKYKATEQERADQEAMDNLRAGFNRNKGKKTKVSEQAYKYAGKLREFKTKPIVIRDADGNPIEIETMGMTMNDIIEIGAQALETVGKIADAMSAMVEALNQQPWYQNLSERDQEAVRNQIRDMVDQSTEEEEIGGQLRIPKWLVRKLVEEGAQTMDEVIEGLRMYLPEQLVNISDREIRDAVTGYGKTVNLSQDEIDVTLRRIKRIGQLVSKIEDARNKIRPLRSGLQRDKLEADERAMQKELNELMKDIPQDAADEAKQLKSALDAIKTRLRNQMEDIERAIETGEAISRASGVPYDDEATQLRTQRDELKKQYDEVFGDDINEKARINRAERASQRALDKVNKQIAENDLAMRRSTSVTSPKLQAIKAQLEAQRIRLEELRTAAGIFATRQLEQRKEAAKRQIAEYEKRLREKDFGPRKKKSATIGDQELVRLLANKQAVKDKYDRELYAEQLRNLKGWAKWRVRLVESINLPRALVTGFEFSAMLIQGWIMTISSLVLNPKRFALAVKNMIQHFASPTAAHNWLSTLKSQPYYGDMKADGLRITDLDGKASQREDIIKSNYINTVWKYLGYTLRFADQEVWDQWIAMNPAQAFERGISGLMNTFRVERYLDGWKMLERQGKTHAAHSKEYKELADVMNTATGVPSLGKKLDSVSDLLSVPYFSVRLWYSVIKQMTLLHFVRSSSVARKIAMTDMMTAMAVTGGIYAAIRAAILAGMFDDDDDDEKWQVEDDPRSSNFGKFSKGNIHIDMWGGRQQFTVFMSRMLTQEIKSTSSGEIQKMGYNNTRTMWGEIGRYNSTKLAPTVKFAVTWLDSRFDKDGNRKRFGDELDLQEEALSNMYPMYFETLAEIKKENPELYTQFALSFYAGLGGGVQVYDVEDTSAKTKFFHDITNGTWKPSEYDSWDIDAWRKPDGRPISKEDKDAVNAEIDRLTMERVRPMKDMIKLRPVNDRVEAIKDIRKDVIEQVKRAYKSGTITKK